MSPALTVPAAIQMAVPAYSIDNIIGIRDNSFNITAPTNLTSPTTAADTYTTFFADTCLFQGVYSINSGSTWNDFGVYIPNLTTPGQPVIQTTTCGGYVTSGGVFTAYAKNWYDIVHSVGTAYTVQYKVAFFAKDTQGSVSPIATNEKLQYRSGVNFQKIKLSGSFASGGSTTTIAHSLGYIPKVRAWFSPSSSTLDSEGIVTLPAGCITTLDWFSGGSAASGNTTTVTIDSTNAYFSPVYNNVGTVNGTMYYRIYLDS